MKTYKTMVPKISLVKEKTSFPAVKIGSARDAYDFICQFARPDSDILETAHLVLVNTKATTIGYVQLSVGGTTGTVMDPKIIGKFAIESLAHGVIVAHNHPSGDIQPSNQDRSVTNRIRDMLRALDIAFMDHLILSDNPGDCRFFSFSDEGLI